MKKVLALALAGFLAAGFAAAAPAGAQEYDRYERGTAAPPPPPPSSKYRERYTLNQSKGTSSVKFNYSDRGQ